MKSSGDSIHIKPLLVDSTLTGNYFFNGCKKRTSTNFLTNVITCSCSAGVSRALQTMGNTWSLTSSFGVLASSKSIFLRKIITTYRKNKGKRPNFRISPHIL